nr:hypothetical protein [Tanacetum cinerariifolium]
MIRHDYDITSSLRRGALQLWYQSQTLLPQIHAEICEEFRTSSGPSNASGHPPSVTIHAWLERFNKQKPHSFEKATAPVANAAHNYEILHERDDDDTERPDKRQKSGDRHQPTSQ